MSVRPPERWEIQPVIVETGDVQLPGDRSLPGRPGGVVAFAHGSGSDRHRPRNRAVAESLHRAGHATLLFDLLTTDEEAVDLPTWHLRFDIELLAGRLVAAARWLGD